MDLWVKRQVAFENPFDSWFLFDYFPFAVVLYRLSGVGLGRLFEVPKLLI